MTSLLDAIADPIRARLMRRLAASEPASLEDLAAAASVHPNTVRSHLAAMEASGLVRREAKSSGGRGRPRTVFTLEEGWTLQEDGFRAIAELLAAALSGTHPDPSALRRLGRKWGREYLSERHSDQVEDELIGMLGRLGFDAHVESGQLILRACPCPLISPERPELVCKLVDAVVDGILDASGSRLRASRHTHDPGSRSCSALLQLEAA